MDVKYLVLSLFFLVSCMPSATVSTGNLTATETTSGSSGGANTLIPSSPLKWNFLGQLVNNITVNVSNLQNAYIVGKPIELFLQDSANFTNVNYCVITNYLIGGVRHELRSRAVPISYFDFNSNRTVRILRVDFQDVTNSEFSCPKTRVSRVINSMGNLTNDTAIPPVTRIQNNPRLICENCSSMLDAISVRLSRSNATTLDQIPLSTINISELDMQVDPNYDIIGGAGTCSLSTCQQKGFDCCLENQCVKEGSTKPLASTPQYASLLKTAEEEKLQNSFAYLNYPQLYYNCGIYAPPPTTTGGSTGGNSGPSDLNVLKKDYACIEWIKSNTPVRPFHTQVLSRTYPATTDCLTATADRTNEFHYHKVLERLYKRCGCNRTDLTEMLNNCPNYEYSVTTRDSVGIPTRIDCYTPPTDNSPVPLQQSVGVSGRSAPHRFFNGSGVEAAPNAGGEQEGPEFSYLDDGKLMPNQLNNSMNAILGQMAVTLDQALPAKSVNVELDQVYLISTTSGYYTPCPTCSKDSWLSNFSAFPSSAYGVGLQPTGHTTERDAFSTNTTGGNYEDTIFGRACWLPPTMIPFSHSPNGTVRTQRLNRLQTQATLFANGYQRDWFGFNKGALIGSFDGVTWFAIGKGRIIRSSSKKLFLAINAPFADVASPNTHVVRVSAYDGISLAAQYDYDPAFHQSHPYQNEAGNCQKYHMCETDTDCVTNLGWEYMCADVKDVKTNWPEFDIDAKEKENVSNNLTLDQILQQKRFPSGSTKRCIYRGAGAVCHSNIATYTAGGDLNKKKTLSCAPNFYCANTTLAKHNNKIARFAGLITDISVARNHMIGKDTNVLGRPLDYIANQIIPSTTRNNLLDNLDGYESSIGSFTGLCQPGKGLPDAATALTMQNPFNQMLNDDPLRRTDYISQIGSCNATLFDSIYRHTSCPVLGSDGNYEIFAATTFPTNWARKSTSQNACGLESLLTTATLNSPADSLVTLSPFRAIEARPLNSQIVLGPTFARDACFRRAGAACHTDLDCSPNKMHAGQVDFFSNSYFGNGAERKYWEEYLVCGQGNTKPLPSNIEAFKNYNISKNVCCREVGKDLSTYTSYVPKTLTPSLNYDTDTILDQMFSTTASQNVPGALPNNPRRYSRLATVEDLGSIKPPLSAFQNKVGSTLQTINGANVLTPGQWKTLTEANQETCCGGGWIRKYADGTNDWSRRDRLQLDVSNFRCINSRTPVISNAEDVAIPPYYAGVTDIVSLLSFDFNNYCMDATNTNGVCAQYSVNDTFYDIPPLPSAPYSGSITINTVTPNYSTTINSDFYFQPRSADGNSNTIINYGSNTPGARRNITIRLPSYVTDTFRVQYNSISNNDPIAGGYQIRMITDAGIGITCRKYDEFKSTSPSDPTITIDPPIASCGAFGCCYFSYNPVGRILRVSANPVQYQTTAPAGLFSGRNVGLEFISPDIPGKNLSSVASTLLPVPTPATSNRYNPGSSAYYLKRLGRLELSGIPQITYEMMRCSDNPNRIIPGVFTATIKTEAQFQSTAFSFQHTTSVNRSATPGDTGTLSVFSTNHLGLQHDPIFSSNDFKCCAPLGSTVTDQTRCCSGFGVETGVSTGLSSPKICSLPGGTNLHVYYNRFVSNEGRGTDRPGGGLLETDFDNQTGEPLMISAVTDKIRTLGVAFCESRRVRQGGAFGWFNPEPSPSANSANKIYNIVDSTRDSGQNSSAGGTTNTGYDVFADGFRWNHHLYCED